jgi:selenocysteine lyase/cysteine desulfurase
VLLADDFPSTVYTCRALAEEKGAELVTVERPIEGDWTAALIEAVTPETALVCTPHVHWVCGSLIDLAALSRRCREVGAALVLDTTQSTGALPLDMAAVDPDYRVAASYKWMMGPYSLGFLYVAPRRQGGVPVERGWVMREGAEDFRRLTRYPPAYAAGARRFDMGERSNFALLPVAGAAIEQLLAWGLDNISETLGYRTSAIAARLVERGITAVPEHLRGPHYLSVRFPDGIDDATVERLATRNVHVSIRGESMRITPHLYNNDEDVERLIEAL